MSTANGARDPRVDGCRGRGVGCGSVFPLTLFFGGKGERKLYLQETDGRPGVQDHREEMRNQKIVDGSEAWPKASGAKLSRENCKPCSSAGTASGANTAGRALPRRGPGSGKPPQLPQQPPCCLRGTRRDSPAVGTNWTSPGGTVWLLHGKKKKPVIELTEWFGPGLGLDGGPVMSERPEETLESGVENGEEPAPQ